MRTLKIGEREFAVRQLSPKLREWFMDRVRDEAKLSDNPVARLIATKLNGVEGQDREYALKALMSAKGWDDPPVALVNDVLHHVSTLRLLFRLAVVPEPAYELACELITADTADEIFDKLNEALKPLSKEEVVARNRAFAERIRSKPKEMPCQDQTSSPTTAVESPVATPPQ